MGQDGTELISFKKGQTHPQALLKRHFKAQVFLTSRTQMTIFFFVLLNKGGASVCNFLLFFMHSCLSFGGKERHTQPRVL